MAFITAAAYQSCLLVVNCLAVAFLGWVLYFVHSTVSSLPRADASQAEIEVLCPCLCGRYSALQLTMRCTVASVAFFFLTNLGDVFYRLLYFALCDECKVRLTVNVLYIVCQLFGYLLMFVTHFERLRLTFGGTSMKLPQWAPNVLYAAVLLIGVLCTLMFLFWEIIHESMVSAVCGVLLIFLYFASVSALVRAFFKKTMAIATKTEHCSNLLPIAVRISVVSSVSLLSTTFTTVVWIVLFALCPECFFFLLLGLCFFALDMCLNAFCLMCTFRRAESYYLRVFGKVHRLCLARVSVVAAATAREHIQVTSITDVMHSRTQ